jgi:hypothetical protein
MTVRTYLEAYDALRTWQKEMRDFDMTGWEPRALAAIDTLDGVFYLVEAELVKQQIESWPTQAATSMGDGERRCLSATSKGRSMPENQDDCRTSEATWEWTDTGISSELIEAQRDINSFLNATVDASSVAISPPKLARTGFMARCIIAVATAWNALSGAAASLHARAIDIARKGFRK